MSLSAYELSRAERIKANNAYLMSLGLLEDAKAMKAKPKAKAPPKPKPDFTSSGPGRTSSRLSGVPIIEEPVVADSTRNSEHAAERDPMCCWWTVSEEMPEGVTRPPLTPDQHRALSTPLSAAERGSLVVDDADEWVHDLLCFFRAYGGQRPEAFCVPSRENVQKVLDSVAVLASGDGVTCAYRGGAFDAGVRYTPRDDLDEALGRALKWLPKKQDKSNGWTFTHPFEKMKQYQRALFWRHLFPFVWQDARPTADAQAAARARAEATDGAEAEAWGRMALAPAPSKPSVAQEQTRAPDAVPADDEDQPIAKRARTHAGGSAPKTQRPSSSVSGPMAKYSEGQIVEVQPRDAELGVWRKARVDNVNEEDGSYDLVFVDGDAPEDEDGVAVERIRPLDP